MLKTTIKTTLLIALIAAIAYLLGARQKTIVVNNPATRADLVQERRRAKLDAYMAVS